MAKRRRSSQNSRFSNTQKYKIKQLIYDPNEYSSTRMPIVEPCGIWIITYSLTTTLRASLHRRFVRWILWNNNTEMDEFFLVNFSTSTFFFGKQKPNEFFFFMLVWLCVSATGWFIQMENCKEKYGVSKCGLRWSFGESPRHPPLFTCSTDS